MIGSLCLEKRNTMHCLLLDFAKGFDSVPHECLLLKLSSLATCYHGYDIFLQGNREF